jgi:hypothetical protein
MARGRLTACKHVRMPPPRRERLQESYSDGRHVGYFPRTLGELLRSLGYHAALLYVGMSTLLRGSTFVWNVHVVLYERATTDRIRRTSQIHEATAPRATFEAGIRDAARQALTVLHHKEDDTMDHSQFRHFPSRPYGGSNTVVLPAGHGDPVGCLHEQVCLIRAMDGELDQAMFEVQRLCEQEREAKRKIDDLEFLCEHQDEQIKELDDQNKKPEEELKECEELIKELMDRLRGQGPDDDGNDDAAYNDDDGDDDDEGNNDAAGDDVGGEDDEDPEMLIPEEEEPEEVEILGLEGMPEPPSRFLQPSLYMQLLRDHAEDPSPRCESQRSSPAAQE